MNLKNETTAAQLLQLGGGLLPEADPSHRDPGARQSDQRQRVTARCEPAGGRRARQQPLQSGDICACRPSVPVLDELASRCHGSRASRRASISSRPGMRLTDVLPSLDELEAERRSALHPGTRESCRRTVRSACSPPIWRRALANPQSAANFELAPRDQIFVFDRESGRSIASSSR